MVSLWADDDVDHRRAALGFRAFGLGDATGKRDQRLRAILAPQAANVGIGLLGGFLADVAGVEDDEVGVIAFGGRSHAFGGEQFAHSLTVIDVHLAAEAFDFESLGGHSASPIGEWWCEVKPSCSAMRSRASCVSCLRSPERSSGSSTRTVTGKVPLRPRIRKTLSLPDSSYQPISAAAARP